MDGNNRVKNSGMLTEEERAAFKPVPAAYTDLEDPFHMRMHMPLIAEALEKMRSHSPLGAKLYDWAKQRRIKFRYDESYALASYSDDERMVRVNPKAAALNTMIYLVAHELMHGVQFENSAGDFNPRWDIRSLIKRSMFLEAGAVAAQMRVAYEMKLNGYDGVWNALLDPSEIKDEKLRSRAQSYVSVAAAFEEAYQKSKTEGLTDKEMLGAAAAAAYQARLQNQDLRDRYNTTMISRYFNNIAYADTVMEVMREDKVVPSTQIAKDEFVANAQDITAPQGDEDIFGNNVLLRHAADYLDAYRDVFSKGGEYSDAKINAIRTKLDEDGNMFAGMDYVVLLWRTQKNTDGKPVFELMKDIAGVSGDNAAHRGREPPRRSPQNS